MESDAGNAQIRRDLHDLVLLANLVAETDGMEDEFKFMKMAFYFEFEAFTRKQHGFFAEFFRYRRGAYSKDLDRLRHALVQRNWFEERGGLYTQLTEPAFSWLAEINRAANFEHSQEFALIQEIASQYKSEPGRHLMEKHYALNVRGKRIEDYEQAETILTGADFAEFPAFLDTVNEIDQYRIYKLLFFPELKPETLEYEPFSMEELRSEL